jgi:hypothetical protein
MAEQIRLDTQTMATLCKKTPNSLEEPRNPSDAPSAPPSSLLPSYLTHQTSSHRTLPLQLIPGKELKEIEKD